VFTNAYDRIYLDLRMINKTFQFAHIWCISILPMNQILGIPKDFPFTPSIIKFRVAVCKILPPKVSMPNTFKLSYLMYPCIYLKLIQKSYFLKPRSFSTSPRVRSLTTSQATRVYVTNFVLVFIAWPTYSLEAFDRVGQFLLLTTLITIILQLILVIILYYKRNGFLHCWPQLIYFLWKRFVLYLGIILNNKDDFIQCHSLLF